MAADHSRRNIDRRALTERQVHDIRATYRPRQRPFLRDLAKQYGVSIPTIWLAANGQRYKVF